MEPNSNNKIDIIEIDMLEDSEALGAMVCDFNTFKSIYKLNARTMDRQKIKVVLAMINVTDSDIVTDVELQSVNRIGAALTNSLRRQDVLTGFDTSQFLIMLSNINIEDAKKVLLRLLTRINNELGREINLETSLQVLEPVRKDSVLNT